MQNNSITDGYTEKIICFFVQGEKTIKLLFALDIVCQRKWFWILLLKLDIKQKQKFAINCKTCEKIKCYVV